MIEVDKEYIGQAINDLHRLLGCKENIPYFTIEKPFRQGKIQACIEAIAGYLGLPIKVNLSYVPSDYNPNYSGGQRFESQALTVTDGRRRNVVGITAQVSIPNSLPMYGTTSFVDFPINVKISDNITKFPSTFYATMAHELSHIVLHSLQHYEKDNEVYTDITAMLLGFSEVLELGRKTITEHEEQHLFSKTIITETVTYGYLSDENFEFARKEIAKILKQNKKAKKEFVKKYFSLQKRANTLRKNILKFKKYMESLDKSCETNIEPKDAQRIVEFHKWGYIAEIENSISVIEQELKEKQKYKLMSHFLYRLYDNLNNALETLSSDIRGNENLLHDDLIVLKRNVSFLTRLRFR